MKNKWVKNITYSKTLTIEDWKQSNCFDCGDRLMVDNEFFCPYCGDELITQVGIE